MDMQRVVSDWFIFYKDQLLLYKHDDTYRIPSGELPAVAVSHTLEVSGNGRIERDVDSDWEMPEMGKRPARAASVETPVDLGPSYVWMGLRTAWEKLDGAVYKQAGRAFELVHWDRNSRFCSACGTPTEQNTVISKRCPACGKEMYPVISAAILVLVRKGEQVLLVRARNFKGTFHSLVAGFLEAGETLEECVAREVKEETGLDVCNITYWGNQPWPYPSGLMVGFIADYAGGEIRLQEEELCAGAFYAPDALPELPRKLSLARRMIDWWLERRATGKGGDWKGL